MWIEHTLSTMLTYVTEVFFSSLLGMALFKFGITQGDHSSICRFCFRHFASACGADTAGSA
jgi:hypothetical protein